MTTKDTNVQVKMNDTVDKKDWWADSGSNLFTIRSIQYPDNTDSSGTGSQQRHFVRFTINLDEESRLVKRNKSEVTDSDRSGQNRFRTNNPNDARYTGAAVAIGTATAASGASAALSKFKGFGKKLAVGGAGVAGALAGVAVAKQFDVMKKLKKLAATITLYAPGNLESNHTFEYSTTSNQLADFLTTERGADLMMDTEIGKSALTNVPEKLIRIVGTNASDMLQSLTRTASNPKKDVLFQEVQPRIFRFDYTFMPKNAIEAYNIANIIYMFKYFAHPEMLEGYDQFLYIYPAEFDIEYIFSAGGNENENIWLNRVSSCVLTNISINYAPNGNFHSLANGEPVMTTMSLTFREIETLHRDRIAAGF